MSVLERGMFGKKKRKIDEIGGGSNDGGDKITELTELSEKEDPAPTTAVAAEKSLSIHDIAVCKHILDVCFRRGMPCDGGALARLGSMYDAFKAISAAPTEKGKEAEISLNVGMIMLMIQFIDLAAKAGTINAKEMKLVGHVYGNLEAFAMAYQASSSQPVPTPVPGSSPPTPMAS